MALRVAFAGTPEFALPSLTGLVEQGFQVARVFTQPDRRSGRGQRVSEGPVKTLANKLGLEVSQPSTLKEQVATINALQLDALIVVAYGLLIPPAILALPRHGCINVHASLLPRWRGAAPIPRAIESGDAVTGVTIMQMEVGLDTGPILARRTEPITALDTAQTLHDRLALIGAQLLVETLPRIVSGELCRQPQDPGLATYAAKITTAEARIDWADSARQIERRVRAFIPWPICHTSHAGNRLRVWAAEVAHGSRATRPGEVLEVSRSGITVACADGALRLTELQRVGGKRMPVAQFVNGYRVAAGECFE